MTRREDDPSYRFVLDTSKIRVCRVVSMYNVILSGLRTCVRILIPQYGGDQETLYSLRKTRDIVWWTRFQNLRVLTLNHPYFFS